jgi:hypothetical protein
MFKTKDEVDIPVFILYKKVVIYYIYMEVLPPLPAPATLTKFSHDKCTKTWTQ